MLLDDDDLQLLGYGESFWQIPVGRRTVCNDRHWQPRGKLVAVPPKLKIKNIQVLFALLYIERSMRDAQQYERRRASNRRAVKRYHEKTKAVRNV
jgi:hypothetical protein